MRPIHGEFVSTSHEIIPPTEKLITFTPSIFQVPNKPLNEKLISVMMPFNTAFSETYNAIKRTAGYENSIVYEQMISGIIQHSYRIYSILYFVQRL